MQLPPAPPYEVDTITSHEPDLIPFEFFKKACYAWGHWQIAMGTPMEQLQNPETFVTEADYDCFLNVVNNWPRAAAMRPPTLLLMVNDLRTMPGATATSFAQRLDEQHERILDWMTNNGVDPTNPNESREERAKRKNRENVARYRQRHSQPKSDDPEEVRLVEALRTAAQNVQLGKAWLRERERDHKAKRDVAITEARSACAKAILEDTAHLTEAEKKVVDAQTMLNSYRINK